jgi:hypothetical protein
VGQVDLFHCVHCRAKSYVHFSLPIEEILAVRETTVEVVIDWPLDPAPKHAMKLKRAISAFLDLPLDEIRNSFASGRLCLGRYSPMRALEVATLLRVEGWSVRVCD